MPDPAGYNRKISETAKDRGNQSMCYWKLSAQSIQGKNCFQIGCKI